MTTSLVVITEDWHVNSTVSICPEHGIRRDGGEVCRPSPVQEWLNGCWREFWQEAERRWKIIPKAKRGKKVAVVNGDVPESFHHGSTEIVTLNEADELQACQDVAEPMIAWADLSYVVRGTEIHGGKAGQKEEMFAERIGAVRGIGWSWWSLPLRVEGVKMLFAHHPGTASQRGWTLGGAANRAAAQVILDFVGEELPALVVYGHNHVYEDSGDNFPMRCIIGPAWQAKTAYVRRRGHNFGLSTIGGMIVECRKGKYTVEVITFKARRDPWHTI